ncbi:MAG TPA: hypothetical protein DEF34_03155 [Desulfotomaculum sp.]|nr:MAG: hypothetical protein JL56_02775 [Desulfotomaculum sp. BICA1-6]HBX22625.1 hypothetical protein [Desulfotomaculum sp.]
MDAFQTVANRQARGKRKGFAIRIKRGGKRLRFNAEKSVPLVVLGWLFSAVVMAIPVLLFIR